MGQALAPVRDQVVLSTKFGLTFDFASGKTPLSIVPDSRPETIRRSVEGSLRRLGTDHIDLYFQHRIDPAVAPEEVAEGMADLIREGRSPTGGSPRPTRTTSAGPIRSAR